MSKWIPERPLYRKERLIAGYPTLAVFALLFLLRMLGRYVPALSRAAIFRFFPHLRVFALPIAVFLAVRGSGYLRFMRFNTPRASHLPFLISSFFVLLCGCLLLSILCGGMESLGNSATAYDTAPASRFGEGALAVLSLAILPAILEEVFFRGILVAEYERRGGVRAVLMSALLFALLHFDIHNLAVYLFSGVLFALVLFATDSLPATMALHICYNIVSLFGQRYLNALYAFTGSLELFLFSLILIFLVALIFFLKTMSRIYRLREQNGITEPRRAVPYEVQFYTILDALADPPILLCIVLSILGFILL